ncbi:hypothetical protein [Demequina globuliformis]|uniref:hypothetical protein n=1 Tax=Demequina globuliformis TaxID=676202 RepID=UPI0007866CC1|nr:hypothetical protein [Demequina globuliformis]
MSRIGDELRSSAGPHGDAVAATLASTAVPADLARAARTRRRTRGVRAALVGTAGVAVVATGAWMLAPEPPLPAMQVADGTVAPDVAPMPPDFGMDVCSSSMEPYVPWAEPGVALASDEVRDLGILIDAHLFSMDADAWNGPESVTEHEQGEAVMLEHAPSDSSSGDMVGVQFEFTWPGDQLYEVEALAFLVSQDRVHSPMMSWPMNVLTEEPLWVSGDGADYDSGADRSSLALVSLIQPGVCHYQSTAATRPIPPGPAELHTLVQVKDESGEPLVTFVDAQGLDGTTVDYAPQPGDPTTPEPTASASPVTQAQIDAVLDTRANLEPVPSVQAVIRDAIAQQGAPLSEAGDGIIQRRPGEILGATPLDDRVLTFDYGEDPERSLLPPAPSTVSMEVLESGGSASFDQSWDGRAVATDGTLMFLDSDGVVVGRVDAYFEAPADIDGDGDVDSEGATGGWMIWNDGTDIEGTVGSLEEGETYTVVGQTMLYDPAAMPEEVAATGVNEVWAWGLMGETTIE